MGPDLDGLLIEKMRRGDDAAIETFVRKYYPQILTYCRHHTLTSEDAEDTTQETFACFFRTFAGYRHYGKALNYLYVVAGHACANAARAHHPPPAPPEPPGDPMRSVEVRFDVQAALDSLPEEMREVALLFFVQQQKQRDIAKILNIGLPLVKYRIRRARELLTACLEKGE